MTSKLPRTSMSLKQSFENKNLTTFSRKLKQARSRKFGPKKLHCKQFMVHQDVLKLYRNIMKTIRKIPDKQDRDYMRNWAKSDFRANKDIKDEFAIKSLIVHGENSLRELQKNLNLTK